MGLLNALQNRLSAGVEENPPVRRAGRHTASDPASERASDRRVRGEESQDLVVYLRFPGSSRLEACEHPEPPTKGRRESGSGETARALDTFLILEAVARTSLDAREGGEGSGSGIRLGSLILASGLSADEVLEILADLEQSGLVDGGERARCFRLAPGGREELSALGIDVSNLVGNLAENLTGDLAGDLAGDLIADPGDTEPSKDTPSAGSSNQVGSAS